MRCTSCGFTTDPNVPTCVHCGALTAGTTPVGPVQPSYDQPTPLYTQPDPGYTQPPQYDQGAYPYEYQPASPAYPPPVYQYPAPVMLPPTSVPPEPPPTRRRFNPVWAIGGVVLLLTAVLIGTQLPLLRHGNGQAAASTSPTNGGGPGPSGPVAPTTAGPTGGGNDSGDPAAEAASVNALLGSTSGSRSKLGKALNDLDNCPSASQMRSDKSAIDQVATERGSQLTRARALDLHAIQTGDAVKNALVNALSHSVQADHDYSAWASDEINGDCGTTPNRTHGDMVSGEADKAKQQFVILWNPIAVQYGLPTRVETDV